MSSSEKQVLLADGAKFDDELSLLDLGMFVRRHRLALLGGSLIGGALGLAVAFALPAQWEAVARLQVAQLGAGGVVEPPIRVVERVMQRSFAEDVERRMNVSPEGTNLNANILVGSLKAKIEKSDLVGIRVRGGTPEEAMRFTDAVVAELASVHSKMAEPTIDRWRKELEEVQLELKRANSEAERLSIVLGEQRSSANDNSLYRAVLASNILLAREGNLRTFRERKRALQEQLSPERTFPTSPLGRIEISKQPVFPKKSLFAVAGLVIGLFIGVLYSVVISAGTRRSVRVKN